MNEINPTDQNEYPDDEINLIDLLLVLLRRKRMILYIVLGAIILSVFVSLILPKMYTATARILPPQESSPGLSGLLSQAGGALGGLASSFMGGQSGSDTYVGILKSRTIADELINKFSLKELYGKEYLEDVYKGLAKRTNIDIAQTDQIISVSVEDHDPQRAADMANAYVDGLDSINRKVNVTAGQRKRIFLEKRLKNVGEDLEKAETELKQFQEKHKLVAIDEQAKAAIEGASQIKGEIIAAQTELEVLKQFGTERQNEAVMLKSKIAELRHQLTKIESGNPDGDDKDNFYVPFKELPALGMQLIRLMREAKIQEKVFELMTTEYELAKIEEAKDVNTIQVLDKAVPPDKKSSPKRSLIVILSTFVAFFIAMFLAFFMEFIERIKTEDEERYQEIVQGLKIWKSK